MVKYCIDKSFEIFRNKVINNPQNHYFYDYWMHHKIPDDYDNDYVRIRYFEDLENFYYNEIIDFDYLDKFKFIIETKKLDIHLDNDFIYRYAKKVKAKKILEYLNELCPNYKWIEQEDIYILLNIHCDSNS